MSKKQRTPKRWLKHIANPHETPWLDWIEDGFKIYEGRVYQGDWREMKVGDIIDFYIGERD